MVEMKNQRTRSMPSQYSQVAEYRELPYDMRYWNIIHLLNAEQATGKQMTPNLWCQAEDWVFDENSGIPKECLTARDILSPRFKATTPADSVLKWFLSYDSNAEKVSSRYQRRLTKFGIPKSDKPQSSLKTSSKIDVTKDLSSYKVHEKLVRYEKLPDRMVPAHSMNRGRVKLRKHEAVSNTRERTASNYYAAIGGDGNYTAGYPAQSSFQRLRPQQRSLSAARIYSTAHQQRCHSGSRIFEQQQHHGQHSGQSFQAIRQPSLSVFQQHSSRNNGNQYCHF
ncbi:hypothetical protein ACOME3_002748 [Neoechinorhynchus agilis]